MLLNFALFSLILFITYLLLLIKEGSDATLSAFEEGSIEHMLERKICLYGFHSVFSQIIIEICLLSLIVVLFVTAKKFE